MNITDILLCLRVFLCILIMQLTKTMDGFPTTDVTALMMIHVLYWKTLEVLEKKAKRTFFPAGGNWTLAEINKNCKTGASNFIRFVVN